MHCQDCCALEHINLVSLCHFAAKHTLICLGAALLCTARQVKCILHESGHIFGAPHTHEWCNLDGAIDTIGKFELLNVHSTKLSGQAYFRQT